MKNLPPDVPSSDGWVGDITERREHSSPDRPSTPARPPSPNKPSSQTPARVTWKSWQVAATAAVVLMMGGAGFMLSRPDASVPAATTVMTAPRVTTQIKETHVAPEVIAATMPKWFRARESGWASDGSRTVTFELEAENEVAVWMKRVRPMLAVRCLGRQTEAYIVTDSAASIEPTPDKHTVRIGFDKQADVEQRWLDSTGHRELFSPDAATLASQIAQADKMRFSFTPFNSAPVTAQFDVHGFGPSLEIVTKTCRNDIRKDAARRDVRKEVRMKK
jgi:hypothetical protein